MRSARSGPHWSSSPTTWGWPAGWTGSSASKTGGSPWNTPLLSFTLRDLLRNPRRTLASVIGVALAVGLFSGIVFFVDSSAATMTQRAVAPVAIDMQAGVTSPLASPLALTEAVTGPASLAVGQTVTVTLTVTNTGNQP